MAKKKDRLVLISWNDGGNRREFRQVHDSELPDWTDYHDLRIHEVDEGKRVKIKTEVIVEELS